MDFRRMDLRDVEQLIRERLDALGPAPRAELMHVLMLPDSERAGVIGDFYTVAYQKAPGGGALFRVRIPLVGGEAGRDPNAPPIVRGESPSAQL